jgi:hypothetical protein
LLCLEEQHVLSLTSCSFTALSFFCRLALPVASQSRGTEVDRAERLAKQAKEAEEQRLAQIAKAAQWKAKIAEAHTKIAGQESKLAHAVQARVGCRPVQPSAKCEYFPKLARVEYQGDIIYHVCKNIMKRGLISFFLFTSIVSFGFSQTAEAQRNDAAKKLAVAMQAKEASAAERKQWAAVKHAAEEALRKAHHDRDQFATKAKVENRIITRQSHCNSLPTYPTNQ